MTSHDREAIFRQWFEAHLGVILKVVRGCTAAPQDQDDLLQDILLQLWSSIPSFRRESKETTWIYRVAFNTAMAWRRGERRRREGHESFAQFDLPAPTQSTHADSASSHEIIERLYAAIRQLPKADASLALMHLDGLSYSEMAEVSGISENYVGVKLTRIRKQLADLMKGATYGIR
jgi:RNA polymerase sigma-70 factor, ECF subfamily